MNELPLVSIVMITYNHELYIEEAINGVLIQETVFKYELIVANDCSTDSTDDKIQAFLKNHPKAHCVKYLNHKKNLGMIPNFINALESCVGKYIALCEGDDYWTNPLKIQKQIDFLEKNEKYSATAHQIIVKYENQDKPDHLFNDLTESDISLDSLFANRKFHTASFVFRKEIIDGNFSLFSNITSGDKAIFLLCGYHGDIRFFEEPMAVYRKNDGGISSWVTIDLIKKDFNMIGALKHIYPSFPKYKYTSFIHKTILSYYGDLNNISLLKHYLKFGFYSFSYFPANIREIIYLGKVLLKHKFKKSY
jgi:glycosyltransferase involved in cell wall biosynthesis